MHAAQLERKEFEKLNVYMHPVSQHAINKAQSIESVMEQRKLYEEALKISNERADIVVKIRHTFCRIYVLIVHILKTSQKLAQA